MELQAFELTRRSMHAVAELVLAGAQYAESADIRLRVVPGGIATVTAPDLRIAGGILVAPNGRHPLEGTYAELASAAGVVARDLSDVYSEGSGVRPDEPIRVDPDGVAVIIDAFERGDAAMRRFAPSEEPVLWPEHFDVGISLNEVNYGVSPGDAHISSPYAYVGPWTPRQGPFWNVPFGAARVLAELPTVNAVEAFFREGAGLAATGAKPSGDS